MEFIDHIQALAARASKQRSNLMTEEGAKNALVMPFINALGYNVFDPLEVTPEFNADVGIKKGEKVDYAIMKGGQPIILFECKAANVDLGKAHASQLYRYFSVTSARIGVLTNGLQYHFYSDVDAPNRMDAKPFLEFDILNIREAALPELKKLTKAHFDVDAIVASAGGLKFTKEVQKFLAEQLTSPDEDMVKLLASKVYDGRLTKTVREQFDEVVRRAFRNLIHDQVSERLKSALQQNDDVGAQPTLTIGQGAATEAEVVTTLEEIEGFHIVRAILAEVVDPERIAVRDVKTYFGVLLDDNNRKPLCRLHFNTSQKYIGLFDNERKEEERVPIEKLTDLYKLAGRIRSTPKFYEVEA